MTSPNPQPKLDVILERLDNLKAGQLDIATNLSGVSCNFQNFQLNYAKAHETLAKDTEATMQRVSKIETAMGDMLPVLTKTETIESRLGVHDAAIKELEKKIGELADDIKPLIFVNRIFVWVGAALGVSIVGLIWGILTHHVELLYH
jgi:hypothetical protein